MQNKTNIDLLAPEVAGLWITYVNDSMAVCTLKHFLNTLRDEEIRHILQSALDSSNGHLQLVTDKFNQETDSTISPFSGKLMAYTAVMLFGASIIQDGNGLANVMRHDLQAHYTASAMDTAKYAEDGLDILIENKWMEQPPQVIEHRELVKA